METARSRFVVCCLTILGIPWVGMWEFHVVCLFLCSRFGYELASLRSALEDHCLGEEGEGDVRHLARGLAVDK